MINIKPVPAACSAFTIPKQLQPTYNFHKTDEQHSMHDVLVGITLHEIATKPRQLAPRHLFVAQIAACTKAACTVETASSPMGAIDSACLSVSFPVNFSVMGKNSFLAGSM